MIILPGVAILSLTACEGQKNKEAKSSLTTQLDSVSYGIGVSIGGSLKKDGLDQVDVDLIAKGMTDAMKGEKQMITAADANMVIQQYMQAAQKKKAEANLAKEKKFLEENGKKQGVTTLPSGLQYQVEKMGTGPKPVLTDKVTVHYHGTTIDGVVFDSSVERGQPYQTLVNQVVPGWVEALQLMPVGSKWKLFIPSTLAYGERGSGPKIGPNETLIFDLELISIDKEEAPKK